MTTLTILKCSLADAAQTLSLAWKPSPDPTVIGYNIYYGTTNSVFDHKVSVSGANSTTISGLREGATYYFVATAYDAVGLESLPTPEISYTVPGAWLTIVSTNLGSTRVVQVASANVVNASWTLQSSSNLNTWVPLASGSYSTVQVTVSNATAPAAFFRLSTP